MNRLNPLLFALTFSLAVTPLLHGQDAAAPIRRTSPSPSGPAPTPLRESVETPTPEPTPTAPLKREETPAPAKPTPAPVAETPAPPLQTPAPPQETPTPAPTQETPTPAPPVQTPTPAEQTPAPSAPMPSEQTPTPTPSAKESKPAASSRSVLREKPVRAVEPRPRRPWSSDPNDYVGSSRPTFDFSRSEDSDVSTIVRNLENKWQKAIRNHDVATVNELLAEDFVGTSSTGRVGSKSTLLSELRRDKNEYKSVEARGMSVRTPGEDTAIVTGISKESGTTKDGKRFTTSRRFTDTWVKRNKQWRCIASQTTELSRD